jgi:hypothetical protein
MNGDGVCETERRFSPGTTRTLLNLTGPRMSNPGEKLSAVPNLDRDRGGLLDVREKS